MNDVMTRPWAVVTVLLCLSTGCEGDAPEPAQVREGTVAHTGASLQLRAVRDRGAVVEIEVAALGVDRMGSAVPTLFVGEEVVRAHRLVRTPHGDRLHFMMPSAAFARVTPAARLALRLEGGPASRPGFSLDAPVLGDVAIVAGER